MCPSWFLDCSSLLPGLARQILQEGLRICHFAVHLISRQNTECSSTFWSFWFGKPWMNGVSSPGKPYWLNLKDARWHRWSNCDHVSSCIIHLWHWNGILSCKHLASFQLNQLQKLLVIHHVNLGAECFWQNDEAAWRRRLDPTVLSGTNDPFLRSQCPWD